MSFLSWFITNPIKAGATLALLALFGSWSWISILVDAIGLLVVFISGFAIYSWIFLAQIPLYSLSDPFNSFKELGFVLSLSKTWADYSIKRLGEVRARPQLLINPRPMRPASNTSASSEELNRLDPLIISKYQKAAGEFIMYASRDFIQVWFQNLSPSPIFSYKVENSLWFVFHELTRRFERMDFVQFIIYKMLPIFTIHLKEVAKAEKLARGENLRIDDSDLDVLRCYKSGKIHPATSAISGSTVGIEQAYLRKLLKPIIPVLLPKSEGDVKIITVLLREILVCKVFQPIIDSLADSDFWNQTFDMIAEKLILEYSLDKKFNEAMDRLERSDDEFEDLDLANRPPSFDNFIKQIKKCDNLLDAFGIRDTIHTEIVKKKHEIAGCGSDDIINGVRVSEIRIYINRLNVAEKRIDKRIKALGGKTLNIISNDDSSRIPPKLIETLEDPHLLSSFVYFIDKDGRLPYLQLYMILTGIEDQTSLLINSKGDSWVEKPDSLLIEDLQKLNQDFFLDTSVFIDINNQLAHDFQNCINRLDISKSLFEQSLEWFHLLKKVKLDVLHQMEMDYEFYIKSSAYQNQKLNVDLEDDEVIDGLSYSDKYRMILADRDKFRFKVSNFFKKNKKDPKSNGNDALPSRKDAVDNVEGELQSIIASEERGFSLFKKGVSSKGRSRKKSIGEHSSDSEYGSQNPGHIRKASFSGGFLSRLSRSATEPAFHLAETNLNSISSSKSQVGLNMKDSSLKKESEDHISQLEQELAKLEEEILELKKNGLDSKSSRQLTLMRRGLQFELEQAKLEKKLKERDSTESIFKGGVIVKISDVKTLKEDGRAFTAYPIEVLIERPQETFPASWIIQRRYSEFEALHKKLKTAFSSVSMLEFPGKMLTGLMKMTTQLTEARRRGLEKYLRALLKIPDVRNNSDFIRFLCSDYLLKKVLLPSKADQVYDTNELFESNTVLDLSPTQSNNSALSPNILNSSLSPSGDLSISATDAVIDLFIELFELKERNNWLRHQAVVILLQQLFGGTVERRVTENLGWAGELHTAVNFLEWILSYLWPDGKSFYEVPIVIRTHEQKKKSRSDSLSKLVSLFPEIFGGMVGRSNAKRGAERLLYILQNKKLNQQLIYTFVDELIATLFIELKKKTILYSFDWPFDDFGDFTVACASGLFAFIKSLKITIASQDQTRKLTVVTGSGQVLFSADFEGKAVGVGWTFAETLIIVLEDGNVLIYNLMGEYSTFQLHSFGKIIQAKIYSTGLVALTDSFEFVAVSDLSEPRLKTLKSSDLNCEPESWIVIPPHLSGSKHVEVLISSFDSLMVLDSSFVLDQKIDGVPFKKMALSPNGTLIALFSESGTLFVYSIDFQKCLAKINTNRTIVPLEMAWCGNDSVVLHWDKILWVVGPSGDWISYTPNGRVHLMSECDGIRIISGKKSEFLQKVPFALESIFRIGSTSPGAGLYDAAELYENKNPRAEECIRILSHQLESAVDECIEAAADEFDHDVQKQLMRAASFGKCFLHHYPADKFVQKCRIIRVLNAIRDPKVGLYLTFAELSQISYQMIIKKLVNRNLHVLALNIAKYLNIEFHGVLVHWACHKIKRSIEDENILSQKIIQKFQNSGHKMFSLSEVAKTAYDSGRRKLAIKLLEHEPRIADRVPLLLSMQEDELALNKAIESGDSDLVYFTMFHMKRKLPLAEFFRLLNKKPNAASLLEVYARQNDINLLKDFYYQDDRRADGAKIVLLEGLSSSDPGTYQEKLKMATRMFSDDKKHAFEAKMSDEQVKLLGAQISLEKDLGQSFVGFPVSDTIAKLLMIGNVSKAAKIKSDFKVSEKRFCWLRLKVFVQTQNWDGLDKFVKTTPRFSIISVIETLIRAGHKSQAETYLSSVKNTTSAIERAGLEELLARISLK